MSEVSSSNPRKRSAVFARLPQSIRNAGAKVRKAMPSKETGLNALKFALRTTRDVADGFNFSPLKASASILLDALDRYELSDDVEGDLTAIATRIQNLLAIFEEYRASHREKNVIDFMESLASAIDTVRRLVEKKSEQKGLKRVFNAPSDAKEVVRILRILGDVAERFEIKISVDIDRQMQEVKEEVVLQNIPFIATAQHQAIHGNKGCTQGTRLEFLDDVSYWALNADPNIPPVCWINGPAGMGKTTIMHTMCIALQRVDVLGGNYFCSRDSEDRRTITNIFPTLSQMLALTSPRFRQELLVAIEGHKGVGSFSPDEQFRLLIAKPAREAFGSADPPEPIRIMAIDALDECDDNDDVTSRLLQIISQNARDIRLRFLIASRPEPQLFDTFTAGNIDWSTIFQMQDIPEEISKNDVLTYLTSEWARCSRENPRRSWPTEEQLRLLALQSGGFFIYASTAWKFVSDRRSLNPRTRLSEILESRFVPTDRNVDKLYHLVLEQLWSSQTANERCRTFRCLEAVMCTEQPLRLGELAKLLDETEDELQATLMPFQSVLRVPELHGSGTVAIYHASFAEYLLEGRSHGMPWHINSDRAHQELYTQCWRVMKQQLRFNVSQSRSSYLTNEGNRSNHERANRDEQSDWDEQLVDSTGKPQLPGELIYACRFWTSHISRVSPTLLCIKDLLKSFPPRFLYWLEVLSVIACLHEARPALSRLLCFSKPIVEPKCHKTRVAHERSIYEVTHPGVDAANDHTGAAQELAHFTTEAKYFVTAYERPIAVSAPHIYVSALAYFDERSLLRKAVEHRYRRTLPVLTQPAQQDLSLFSIVSYSGKIRSVAFSPEGKRVASGSDDHTIRMWDADTGAQVGQPLKGHSDISKTANFWASGVNWSSGDQRFRCQTTSLHKIYQ